MSATVALATTADDEGIRALLARNSMPGRVSLSYRREPDYFHGCGPMGPFRQVLVVHEGSQVRGLACRAVRPMFVNGDEEPVGYLGQLRIDVTHRGRFLLAAGFGKLRELHEDRRVVAYVTTVVDGNAQATGLLVRRRRKGMPEYRFVDRLHTLALTVSRKRSTSGERVRAATSEDLPAIVAFLRNEGPRRQFFPALSLNDFFTDVTRDLKSEDFFLIEHDGRLLGVCALWDQSAYKQTLVDHYEGALSTLRPLYNIAAHVLGRPRLPAPGGSLRMAYASFLVVRDDDPAIVSELLSSVLAMAAQRGHEYVIAGFAERDPRLRTARRFPHFSYLSDVYTVAWEDGAGFHDRLDGRPCYLDPATL
jgi:hypothetical protein